MVQLHGRRKAGKKVSRWVIIDFLCIFIYIFSLCMFAYIDNLFGLRQIEMVLWDNLDCIFLKEKDIKTIDKDTSHSHICIFIFSLFILFLKYSCSTSQSSM